MAHYDAQIKDLIVAEAIAGEYTAAEFIATASAKEIQILNEAGSARPTVAGNFYVIAKKADGTTVSSDMIYGPNIVSVTQTSAVTAVPEYAYFTVDNTGIAVNDLVEVYHWFYGNGSASVADWQFKTIPYTVTNTGESVIAAGLAKQIIRNLGEDYYYNNRPTTVLNLAGYDGIYATEAEVITNKDDLTNTRLIWVIANSKPYSVTDKTEATFEAICAEKTDWSGQISDGTAITVSQSAFYDVVITDIDTAGTAYRIYVIAKAPGRVLDKFDGTPSKNRWGVTVKDETTGFDKLVEWAVTSVGEVINPTSGKRLANMESHIDKLTRQFGGYNYMEFPFVPTVVEGTDYYTITIKYKENDTYGDRKIAGRDQSSILILALDSSADSNTLLGYINIAKNGPALVLADLPAISLNDLSDVVIDDGHTGDIIGLAADGDWKNVASDS
jgi:hypothetical protein